MPMNPGDPKDTHDGCDEPKGPVDTNATAILIVAILVVLGLVSRLG